MTLTQALRLSEKFNDAISLLVIHGIVSGIRRAFALTDGR